MATSTRLTPTVVEYSERETVDLPVWSTVVASPVAVTVRPRSVNIGNRLVELFWLSPDGRVALFTSTRKDGRAISNLCALDVETGHMRYLTHRTTCESADISLDLCTVAVVSSYVDTSLSVMQQGQSPWHVDGPSIGSSFKEVRIGCDFVMCRVTPRFTRDASSAVDYGWIGVDIKARAIVDPAVPRHASARRSYDGWVALYKNGDLTVFDLARRSKKGFHLSYSEMDLGNRRLKAFRAGPTDQLLIVTEAEKHYFIGVLDLNSGHLVEMHLPDVAALEAVEISDSAMAAVYAADIRSADGRVRRRVGLVDLSVGVHQVLAECCKYSCPRISRDGTRIGWLELPSGNAKYGTLRLVDRVQ